MGNHKGTGSVLRKIPMRVNKLTVKQFIEFKNLEGVDMEETERGDAMIAMITGIDIEAIRTIPLDELEFCYRRIADLRGQLPNTRIKKTLWIGGKRYRVCKHERKLNSDQLTLCETFRIDTYKHMHLLAATVYNRGPLFGRGYFDSDGHGEMAEAILNMPVGKIYGAVFFYSNRLIRLSQSSQDSFQKATQTIQNRMQEVNKGLRDLGIDTDGTTSSILSQMETRLKRMN